MKLFVALSVLVVATLASPISEIFNDKNKAELINSLEKRSFVKIPDAFGNMKYVDPMTETQEISPSFNVAADTRFLVFTRFNPTVGQVVQFNNMASVRASNFLASRPTRFLIHGWQGDASADINVLASAAYLTNYDVNVIVVDWGVGANTINYITSRNHVPSVGIHIAEFIDNLHADNLVDFGRLSLAGHSLGAHIAGMAGKNVLRGRINTIVGLDPAGPLFSVDNPLTRLAETDAEYVEAIHTDIRSLGIGDPIAQADFYPNGGSNQPGCLTQICDHNRVIDFFVESLTSDRLWGRGCASFAQMEINTCNLPGASMGGEPSNHGNNVRGIFRLPTNANRPFGIGVF